MVIAFINQKGGCGKSSCCFHLGGCLAKMGLKTLLVDADPQGSLSQAFFGAAAVENLAARQTLAVRFSGSLHEPASLAVETGIPNLTIVRSNHHLATFNVPDLQNVGPSQWTIRGLLEELPPFDVTLIDCPPNLYNCSWNAILATESVVIPVPPEDFGAQGMRAVHLILSRAAELNREVDLRGHAVTRADSRLRIHQHYISRFREIYGEGILQTVIPEAVAFKMSLSQGMPVTLCEPKSAAADAIRRLAVELLGDAVATPRDLGGASL